MDKKRKKRTQIVVDSNVLISYLAKPGYIRRFINECIGEIDLITPEYALTEIEEFLDRYSDKFRRKGISVELLRLAFSTLLEKLTIAPKHMYMGKIVEAYELAKEFDEKDTPFIALALKLNIPIWTRDKDMIKYALQTRKFVALDTKAVEDLLLGKSLKQILKELTTRIEEK